MASTATTTTTPVAATKKLLYSTPKDSEDFWKVEAEDHEFWDAYISTRPNYSQPFYKLIHDYHSSHSSSHSLAHDVGCGAGQVAAELANHYAHVIASDTDADHLAVAKSRLTSASVSHTPMPKQKTWQLTTLLPRRISSQRQNALCLWIEMPG
ncbi:MAG: hypothetical protein Q9180_003835 [Flavoplaca navasiana]